MNQQNAPRSIDFEYEGKQYTCETTFKLYIDIENMVAFPRIAAIFSSGVNRSADIPYSHVAHIVYCVMKQANIDIKTPMAALDLVLLHKIKWVEIITALIVNYYGIIPKQVAEEAAAKKLPSSPAKKRKSRSR